MIRFQCSHCEKKMRGPDRIAGRHIFCPQCGQSLTVPAAPAAKSSKKPSRAERLASAKMPVLRCPSCRKRIRGREGEKIHCPRCGKRLLFISAPKEKPPEAAAQPASGSSLLSPFEALADLAPPPTIIKHTQPEEMAGRWNSSKTLPLLISISSVLGLVVVGFIILVGTMKHDDRVTSADNPPKSNPTPARLPDSDATTAPRVPRSDPATSPTKPESRPAPDNPKLLMPSPPAADPLDRPPSSPKPGGSNLKPPPPETAPGAQPSNRALEECNQAIAQDPLNAKLYLGRGQVYYAREEYELAVRDYNQAIQLDPTLEEAYALREVAYAEKFKPGRIPGYKHRLIEGFHVIIENKVVEQNDNSLYTVKPSDIISSELSAISQVVPARPLQILRRVPIWVVWHDDKRALESTMPARYFPLIAPTTGRAQPRAMCLGTTDVPLQANSLRIVDMRAIAEERQANPKASSPVLLHELAHALHIQALGAANRDIRTAYQQAKDRNLYESSRKANKEIVVPLAAANEYEYFAELSCAYFDRLGYFPFTRDELRKYDMVGYRLMESVWGLHGAEPNPAPKPGKKRGGSLLEGTNLGEKAGKGSQR